MKNIAIELLVSIVEERGKQCVNLPSALLKVRKVLRQYAEGRGSTFSELRIIDICNGLNRLEINRSLLAFLDKTLRKEEQKHQAKSRIRQILREVFAVPVEPSIGLALFEETAVPVFMQSLMSVLPRQGSSSRLMPRTFLPLTELGEKLLAVLLMVVSERDVADLDSLLFGHGSDIYQKIVDVAPSDERANLQNAFFRMRRKINNIHISQPLERVSVLPEDFPPLFKQQVSVFLEKAPFGLESEPESRNLAEQEGITVVRLEEITIATYLRALSKALGHIKFEDYQNLDVRDFLNIQVETRRDKSGREYNYYFNRYVDQYRNIERCRESDRHIKGFDTSCFALFLSAIKAVATFNCIFHLHKDFVQTYSIVLDNRSREEHKAAKKLNFDREWIDSEIARLGRKFYSVIKAKSFKFRANSSNSDEKVRNMRFCLFYVYLLMLRYMGCRQQCIRNCKVGKNIVFARDGKIKFYWGVLEMKNDKALTANLDPVLDKGFLGVLIDVLNAYYNHIYPFVRANAGDEFGDQFFVYLRWSKFYRFGEFDSEQFAQIFSGAAFRHLSYGDRLGEFPNGLHPHFFRGMCSDWLYYDVGLSEDNAARFIGDSTQAFRSAYLDKTHGFDAGHALDEARLIFQARGQTSRDALELEKSHQLELAEMKALLHHALRAKEEAESQVLALREKLSQ